MEKIIHLLIPRPSNNHKARILHSSGLLFIASFLVLFQFFIAYLEKVNPSILGYASSISIQDVVNLTNSKRISMGLEPLVLNQTLSAAAYTKGKDMIDRDYWSHVAPDGTSPWSFFTRFGYKYRYAGENLARDFSSASSAVDAWMNSPSHRENMLSPKYKEIGVGIVDGNLAGSDTTIIVQFFGSASSQQPKLTEASSNTTTISNEVEQKQPLPTPTPVAVVDYDTSLIGAQVIGSASDKVLVSPFNTTRSVSFAVVVLLLVVFVVDAYVVSKRRIQRIAGRSFAHFMFLAMILSIVIILKSGRIL